MCDDIDTPPFSILNNPLSIQIRSKWHVKQKWVITPWQFSPAHHVCVAHPKLQSADKHNGPLDAINSIHMWTTWFLCIPYALLIVLQTINRWETTVRSFGKGNMKEGRSRNLPNSIHQLTCQIFTSSWLINNANIVLPTPFFFLRKCTPFREKCKSTLRIPKTLYL